MTIRVTVKGPLFATSAATNAFVREFSRAGRAAAEHVAGSASRLVNRDRGIYEHGWQPTHVSQTPAALTIARDNTAPHAAVQEEGRRAGARMAPVAEFVAWSLRRGITPHDGDTPANRRSMAYLMARKQARAGYRGPRPVGTVLERDRALIGRFFETAGERIARALS